MIRETIIYFTKEESTHKKKSLGLMAVDCTRSLRRTCQLVANPYLGMMRKYH
ncbi:hypothetical protein E2C01_074184 [Portunus trituberculatus]|uniref:Uncharacterized protein n=1 Tax=Portunus trituberculatus TaxID=210409 RepID=A0A5B7IDP4_PORTR|nr:hypothetical protein [Portunus trituberculatus]